MILKDSKAKGSDAERELVRLFWKNGWAAIRVAGSGSSSFPSPDVLASSSAKGRALAIECKSTGNTSKTISKEQLADLKEFARLFGAEPWAGIRFGANKWRFVSLAELEEKKKQTISHDFGDKNGLSFEELVGNF